MQRFQVREASPAEQVLGLEIARGFSTEDQDVRAAQLLSMAAREPSAVYAVLLTALEASFGAQGSYGVLGAASEASFAAVLDLCERVFCGGALAPFKARMRAQFPDAPKVSNHSPLSLPSPAQLTALTAPSLSLATRHPTTTTTTTTQCEAVWTNDHIAYRCRDCGTSESSCMCVDCFDPAEHEGHDFRIYRCASGGCCDCGDPQAWRPEGFCKRHRHDGHGHGHAAAAAAVAAAKAAEAAEAAAAAEAGEGEGVSVTAACPSAYPADAAPCALLADDDARRALLGVGPVLCFLARSMRRVVGVGTTTHGGGVRTAHGVGGAEGGGGSSSSSSSSSAHGAEGARELELLAACQRQQVLSAVSEAAARGAAVMTRACNEALAAHRCAGACRLRAVRWLHVVVSICDPLRSLVCAALLQAAPAPLRCRIDRAAGLPGVAPSAALARAVNAAGAPIEMVFDSEGGGVSAAVSAAPFYSVLDVFLYDAVLLSDRFCDELGVVSLKLLFDAPFKRAYSEHFCRHYPRLVRLFVAEKPNDALHRFLDRIFCQLFHNPEQVLGVIEEGRLVRHGLEQMRELLASAAVGAAAAAAPLLGGGGGQEEEEGGGGGGGGGWQADEEDGAGGGGVEMAASAESAAGGSLTAHALTQPRPHPPPLRAARRHLGTLNCGHRVVIKQVHSGLAVTSSFSSSTHSLTHSLTPPLLVPHSPLHVLAATTHQVYSRLANDLRTVLSHDSVASRVLAVRPLAAYD